VWSASEYAKLPGYDGSTVEQMETGALAPFFCHQMTGHVCAGWAGCHDMTETLAARLGVSRGLVDRSVYTYEPPADVPLFRTGAQAAAHGLRDVARPSLAAIDMARKIQLIQDAKADADAG
jgi:hypothetical protein